eukprot:CAMPEP_0172306174 /NCGR_PEP_ID=MMETSP1058-20130122/7296_1 /TAXON_ID=83371 /ORGANISM="Detonula confervacea, Strain CCMP 353" /LENGTH=1547 /DNA_ID=CAMNT_0013017977 /DNA_START=1 /DNA_END=4644 /DNA_ORIENTATION=-
MASSRWKRFAFFDRKNLSLPPPVVKDLLVPKKSSKTSSSSSSVGGSGSSGRPSTSGGAGNNNNDVNNNNLDPTFLYQNEEPTLEDCVKIGHGEYFSLVAAENVSLPPSLFSASSDDDNAGEDHDGYNGEVQVGVAMKRGMGGDGAPGMQAGIVALHTASSDHSDHGNSSQAAVMTKGMISGSSSHTMTTADRGNGELLLLFASSRNTSLVHCIDVTVRCTPSNPHLVLAQQQPSSDNTVAATASTKNALGGGQYDTPSHHEGYNAFAPSSSSSQNNPNISNVNNNSNTNNNNMANSEELDGWRGHYNPFLSCDGFTIGKKNVNLLGGSSTSVTASSKPPAKPSSSKGVSGASSSSRRKTAAEQRILDEHSSGGANNDHDSTSAGSLFGSSPFANDFPMESSTTPTKTPFSFARIVGLATTTTTTCQPTKSKSSQSTLYVAAITDAPDTVGVVVHANPHLMLSSLPPSSCASSNNPSSSKNNNIFSSYHKPSTTMTPFNYTTHGKPRCVSILPGVVCIGTDIGVVLVYVFKCINEQHAGGNGGRLSLVAEIPAPRASGSGSGSGGNSGNLNNAGEKKKMYAVASVELIGPSLEEGTAQSSNNDNNNNGNSNIHRLFVSYRRRCVQPSTGGSSAGPNGGKSGTNAAAPTSSANKSTTNNNASSSSGPSGGVCCYDLGGLRIPGRPLPATSTAAGQLSANAPVVSARYDMDGRDVGSSCLCDGVSLPPVPPSGMWTSSSKDVNSGVKGGGDGRRSGHGDTNNTDQGEQQSNNSNNSNAMKKMQPRYAVARNDGLHLYSPEEKVGVCPIDGNKLAICSLPPPPVVYLKRPVRRPSPPAAAATDDAGNTGRTTPATDNDNSASFGASYTLVATTDAKSSRDAVDIYDTTNKLVGFHVLLSPGHRALRTLGICSSPTIASSGSLLLRGGRASAIVLTSGGSIVTLTEKVTPDKVDLLVQKNLYGAAISMAFSDPQFYRPEDITALYRRYAEHLYRKGDYSAAMDQYILTIGSLESSHVIFRYLDAPKIGLAVKYLEALRASGLSSSGSNSGVHDELLRTCYLKLGNVDAASKIILTSASSPQSALCDDAPALNPDGSSVSTVPISRNLSACADDPSEMLAAICSLDAPAAVAALVAHGVLIARSLPRETAGVVIALCDGSYSPTAMADAAAGRATSTTMAEEGGNYYCDKYPISLFANAFMENPKLFRLILSHCRRNDCVLTPMLRRTLLELTLNEWNSAKRTGDGQVQKLRHDEAIMMLSENHVDDMGDYEALVIVQAADFADGEVLLYERLNMVPMLLEEYAKSGTDRARRQMLAMCEHQHDPEVFAEVLSHFVTMAGDRLNGDTPKEEASVDSESEIGGLLHDIHEALVMARDHGDLPPVRILRILAGEGHGMFNSDNNHNISNNNNNNKSSSLNRCAVPLSAAMDYVGAVLDDSGGKIHRLKNNVEEYSRLCNDMELEINALLSPGSSEKNSEVVKKNILPNVDIDEMYSNLCQLEEDGPTGQSTTVDRGDELGRLDITKEDFWREMEHSDDPFETICFYISKGYLENI